jgi:hypothetical protein
MADANHRNKLRFGRVELFFRWSFWSDGWRVFYLDSALLSFLPDFKYPDTETMHQQREERQGLMELWIPSRFACISSRYNCIGLFLRAFLLFWRSSLTPRFQQQPLCSRQQRPSISPLHDVELIATCVFDHAVFSTACPCQESRKSIKPANQHWTEDTDKTVHIFLA